MARGIVAYNKRISQTLGTLAAQAFQNGHMDQAAELLGDAVNHFPSGAQMKMRVMPDGTMQYVVLKNGKPVSQGNINGSQFWQIAAHVSDGSAYIHELTKFAASAPTAGGGYASALSRVTDTYSHFKSLVAQYDQATDAGERKSLEKGLRDAKTALDNARAAALKAGMADYNGKTDRGTYSAGVQKNILDAMTSRVTSLPAGVSAAGDAGITGAVQKPKGWWDEIKQGVSDVFGGGSRPQQAANIPTVSSPDQLKQLGLKPGDQFRLPNGTIKVVPSPAAP
jgi:hypothetical protein